MTEKKSIKTKCLKSADGYCYGKFQYCTTVKLMTKTSQQKKKTYTEA